MCVASCKAWGDEAPLEVEAIKKDLFGITLRITALADSIYVKNIVINRGKCSLVREYQERKMEYGDDMDITAGCPRVLEVEAQTDQGDWIFTFR